MCYIDDNDSAKKKKKKGKNGSGERWENCLRNIPEEESTDGV